MIDHQFIVLDMPYVALVGSNVVADVLLETWMGAFHQKRVTTLDVRIDQLIYVIGTIESGLIIDLHCRVK